jgi:Bacterial TniB protein
MTEHTSHPGPTGAAAPVPFPAGPVTDRATLEGWSLWRRTRKSFIPAPVITLGKYKRMSDRQRGLHDLLRIATHSNLPIQDTPMSGAVHDAMRRRIRVNAVKRSERTRPGLMVNGGGFQGKTETVCETAAGFEDEWLALNNYLNPGAIPGTRDLVTPVAYVQTPVTAKPVSICQAILDFYGEDYKGMTLPTLTRTVRCALADHATRVLILDDITRLKMHREADQDVLDFIRDLMNITVVVLVGVGIPTSGLLREGRQDARTGEWLFRPVKDKGRSPNDEAATQTERRFKLVNLDPFSYHTPRGHRRMGPAPCRDRNLPAAVRGRGSAAHRRHHARVSVSPHRRSRGPARMPDRRSVYDCNRIRRRTPQPGPAGWYRHRPEQNPGAGS